MKFNYISNSPISSINLLYMCMVSENRNFLLLAIVTGYQGWKATFFSLWQFSLHHQQIFLLQLYPFSLIHSSFGFSFLLFLISFFLKYVSINLSNIYHFRLSCKPQSEFMHHYVSVLDNFFLWLCPVIFSYFIYSHLYNYSRTTLACQIPYVIHSCPFLNQDFLFCALVQFKKYSPESIHILDYMQ